MKPTKKKKSKSGKVLPIVLAASISTEAVLAVRREEGTVPPHTKTSVKPPSKIASHAVSATLTISSHEAVLPDQPHVEPAGGGGHITDFTLNQLS